MEMFISPFVASPLPVIRRSLTLADLKPKEVLYDLGAGDGRTLIMAAQEFGALGVGIELRHDLVKQAHSKILKLGLDNVVKVIHDDIFKVDLSPADVVYMYLTTSANEKVRPKLETELKRGARVVSHDYEIIGWKPIKVEKFCENPRLGYPTHTIYL
ncbi:MAG: SAM-dependent methyltransferase, partial [Candidatus Bathyarchaeia archaeon]